VNSKELFFVRFGVSLVVYAVLTGWFVFPRLAILPRRKALIWLLAPHTIRSMGLTFLAPAIVNADFPRGIAQQIAYGDLLSVALAMIAIAALRARASFALALVWLFNVVGSFDLGNALVRVTFLDVRHYDEIGALWLMATLWIPLLLISHYLIFQRLLTRVGPHSIPEAIRSDLQVGA
jgi:hypothetical protein